MSGGQGATAGTGQDDLFTFAGTWATGDEFQVVLTDLHSGLLTQIGSGNVTGLQPTYVFTFDNRVYFLSGTGVYFSALDQPTVFNDPNGVGNGFINLSNFFASVQNTIAIGSYQGRLAFCARDNIQIWITDPDPTQFEQIQLLDNTGTFAAESVKSLGDLDLMYLNDTGLRSLRVRDSSLNGFIVDIGSPIDQLVQANLLGGTTTSNAAACGIVDPFTGRYWCYLNGVIYVLSYYPGAKITAWATYNPTYDDGSISVTFSSGNGNIQLFYNGGLLGNAAWNTSPTVTAAHLALAINLNTMTNGGFTATSSGGVLKIIAPGGTTDLYSKFTVTGTAVFTYVQTQPSFVPQKFVTYNGQVFCRTANACYQYGGVGNNTYDGCVASWSTSFMSLKSPGVMKNSQSIGFAATGTWQVQCGMDPQSGVLKTVFDGTQTAAVNTYDTGRKTYSTRGSHLMVAGNTVGLGAAVFSGFNLQYGGGEFQ